MNISYVLTARASIHGKLGSKVDCAACYDDGCSGKIAVEPDIVGPGVSQACQAILS